MPFPEDPLGMRAEVQLGTWTDITGKVKMSDPITHSRGIRNAGTSADHATVPVKIDNKDGAFSRRNPMSPYDGLLSLNTPIRFWLPDGPHFLDLDGDPANYASTPDNAALDITADLDLRVEAEISWNDPAANQVLIQKWGSGQRSYALRVFDQLLNFTWSDDGTTNRFAAQPLPALPERAAVRATLDVNDGTGQYAARLYWAESIAGPWTEIGAGRFGPATSVFSGTAPLRVGGDDPATVPPRTPFIGKGYKAEVRSGIGGTIVAAPDFTAQPLGAAGFTDSAGRVWSYSGNAAVADRQEVLVGEISSWPSDWVPSEQAVWTTVEVAGILRRLGQGQKALDSTLRRRIPSANPIAYWPMEEDSQASRAYSPVKGVQAAAVTGVEWAATDTLPSSLALPRLTAAATLSAIVPSAADGQWQVECVYNADDKAPPTAGPRAEVLSVSATGTIRRWVISMRKEAAHLAGYDASGTAVVNLGATAVEDIFHGWYRLRVYVQDLGGGQMEWVLGWASVSGRNMQLAQTITATAGHVTAVTANWGALTEGWSIGHLSVMPDAANTIYDGSDSAYSGETAWDRMRRLAEEESLPLARIPGALETERVGPQRPQTLLDLFQAAAAADGGMLLEDRRRLGLVYRDRSSLYTQEPALTLVYKGPGLAPPLKPVDDDLATRNDRTISRDGGSSSRAVLETGPLSVQPPPLGMGLYNDSQTLSLADDVQTEPIAYWQLHLGTYDGARYPSVRVLLHKAPELIPAVLKMREGDLIRLTNLPPWVAFGDVDLIATGWTEILKPRTWERTFVCAAGGPWNTAQADHPTYGKANTGGSELAAPLDSTSTAVPVRATAGLAWTTDPAEMPIDIEAGGEVMRVTAIGERILHSNPRFDVDLTGWTGASATLTRTTTPTRVPPGGIASMQIAPNGVAVSGGANSAISAVGSVTPGRSYTAAALAFSAGGWSDLRVCVDWQDAAGAFLSSALGVGTSVAAGVWTPLSQTFVAPVTATRATIRARHGGTPSAAATWYVWDLRLIAVGDQTMTAARSVDGVIKSHSAGSPVRLAHLAIASL